MGVALTVREIEGRNDDGESKQRETNCSLMKNARSLNEYDSRRADKGSHSVDANDKHADSFDHCQQKRCSAGNERAPAGRSQRKCDAYCWCVDGRSYRFAHFRQGGSAVGRRLKRAPELRGSASFIAINSAVTCSAFCRTAARCSYA